VIELLKDFPDNVTAFAFHGHVTKTDYDTVLIPESCGSTSRSPLISPGSIPARSERIQSSTSVTSSTGNAARWLPTWHGRKTWRNSVSSSAFCGPGSIGRFRKPKPAKRANGSLKPNSSGGSPSSSPTHQSAPVRAMEPRRRPALAQLLPQGRIDLINHSHSFVPETSPTS
jgi:hypothetical protein